MTPPRCNTLISLKLDHKPRYSLLFLALLIHSMIPNVPISPNLRRRLLQTGQASGGRFLGFRYTILLPLGTTVYAGDTPTMLAHPPLLEALLVKVLAARSFTPYKFFVGIHIKDADWAFTVNRFATASVVVMILAVNVIMTMFIFGSSGDGGIGKY